MLFMINNISKVCSFVLLFSILVLGLNQIKIISYSDDLKNIFCFMILILTMFTSVTCLATNKSGFLKFFSTVTILTLIAGGIITILQPGINIFIYIFLICSSIFSLLDMFYKKFA